MKSSELKKGEFYYAEFNYSSYRVEVLDAALFTDRTVKRYEETEELVDPPTPFDPQTGKPNPKVKSTHRRPVYETVREPGYKPSRSYGWSSDGAVAGVPCRVESAYRALNPEKFEAEPGERLVRPQDIKYLWSTYTKGVQAQKDREQAAKEQARDFSERLGVLKKELPNAEAAYVGNYNRSTTHVSIPIGDLEAVVSDIDLVQLQADSFVLQRLIDEGIVDADQAATIQLEMR